MKTFLLVAAISAELLGPGLPPFSDSITQADKNCLQYWNKNSKKLLRNVPESNICNKRILTPHIQVRLQRPALDRGLKVRCCAKSTSKPKIDFHQACGGYTFYKTPKNQGQAVVTIVNSEFRQDEKCFVVRLRGVLAVTLVPRMDEFQKDIRDFPLCEVTVSYEPWQGSIHNWLYLIAILIVIVSLPLIKFFLLLRLDYRQKQHQQYCCKSMTTFSRIHHAVDCCHAYKSLFGNIQYHYARMPCLHFTASLICALWHWGQLASGWLYII